MGFTVNTHQQERNKSDWMSKDNFVDETVIALVVCSRAENDALK